MSKRVQSRSLSLVDPRESLSRNNTAAGTQGVALQSVLKLISVEEHRRNIGTEGLVQIPNVRYSKIVKVDEYLQSRFGGETVEEFKYEVVLSQALNQENQ